MYDNYALFPDETERLSFVSNLPCKFIDAFATVYCFADFKSEDFAAFLKKLQHEYPSVTEGTAKLMHFVRANLSLHDASAHIKEMMQEFVTSQVGTISYKRAALDRSLISSTSF
jgi:hypothetical protein